MAARVRTEVEGQRADQLLDGCLHRLGLASYLLPCRTTLNRLYRYRAGRVALEQGHGVTRDRRVVTVVLPDASGVRVIVYATNRSR